MMASVRKGRRKSKNRANKVNLVFDENKRREFLTGFHKRKVQRKKQAQEKLERELKEERKRLKSEAKEQYKKLVVSHRPIPELEHLNEEEYEDDDVNVKIVELSTNDIAIKNNWIGANQPRCASQSSDEDEEQTNEKQVKNEIPGMELTKPKISKKPKNEIRQFQTKKDVKKVLRKQATKNVQKSKIFQKKNTMERRKQKKKSLQLKKQQSKVGDKKNNHKKKGNWRKGKNDD